MKKLGIRIKALGASFRKRGALASAYSLVPRAYKGFTVLFAMLISALLLAVGLAIFDIIFKQVSFATVVRDSNYAIYAADTGSECALYWDFKMEKFATSSASNTPTSGLSCVRQDILTTNQDIVTGGGYAQTTIETSATGAVTTFAIYLEPNPEDRIAVPHCAVVQVIKSNEDGIISTTIISRGYNTCELGNPNRIERAYVATY